MFIWAMLKELLQWVWRSRIRNGRPKILYLPGPRMRFIFLDRLEGHDLMGLPEVHQAVSLVFATEFTSEILKALKIRLRSSNFPRGPLGKKTGARAVLPRVPRLSPEVSRGSPKGRPMLHLHNELGVPRLMITLDVSGYLMPVSGNEQALGGDTTRGSSITVVTREDRCPIV